MDRDGWQRQIAQPQLKDDCLVSTAPQHWIIGIHHGRRAPLRLITWDGEQQNRRHNRAESISDEDRLGYMEDRLGYMEDRLGYMKDRLGYMEYRLGYMEDRLGYMEDRLGYMDDRLGYMEDRLGYMKDRVGYMEDRLG
jgi:archaellum component FlaC